MEQTKPTISKADRKLAIEREISELLAEDLDYPEAQALIRLLETLAVDIHEMPVRLLRDKYNREAASEMSDKTAALHGPSAWDRQVDGDHYKSKSIQPTRYAQSNHLDPLEFSIVKYVSRWRDKNGVVDLRKAQHCLEMLIEDAEVELAEEEGTSVEVSPGVYVQSYGRLSPEAVGCTGCENDGGCNCGGSTNAD